MEEKAQISFIIKSLRKKKGLTQEELAQEIHISRTRLSNIENNKTEPNIYEINKLCDYFSVSSDYLLGRVNYIARDNIIDSIATFLNLSSYARDNMHNVLSKYQFNFSTMDKFFVSEEFNNLIDSISSYNYYLHILDTTKKEQERIAKEERGYFPSEENEKKLKDIITRNVRSSILFQLYFDKINHQLTNILLNVMPQQEFTDSQLKKFPDLLDNSQFANLMTALGKEKCGIII